MSDRQNKTLLTRSPQRFIYGNSQIMIMMTTRKMKIQEKLLKRTLQAKLLRREAGVKLRASLLERRSSKSNIEGDGKD